MMSDAELTEQLQSRLVIAGFQEFGNERCREVNDHPFLFHVHFPNTGRRMYFYRDSMEKDQLRIVFHVLPENVEPLKISLDEVGLFLSSMMAPGLQLQPLMADAQLSRSLHRTETLLIPDYAGVKSGWFYIGLDDASVYPWLYQKFMENVFLQPACVNAAGKEGGVWAAAQFRTAFSGSFLNYEGLRYGNDPGRMLFFVSYSYVPSLFGALYLGETKFRLKRAHIPDDMPADLALALDALHITSQFSVEDLLMHIGSGGVDSVFFTCVLLLARGEKAFLPLLPRVLENRNPAVFTWLETFASQYGGEDLKTALQHHWQP